MQQNNPDKASAAPAAKCEACNGTGRFQGIFSSDPNWPPCPQCSRLLKMPTDRDWYMRKAEAEADHEIGVGASAAPAVTDEMVERACMANFHPDAKPSATELAKMRRSLEAALSASAPRQTGMGEPVAARKVYDAVKPFVRDFVNFDDVFDTIAAALSPPEPTGLQAEVERLTKELDEAHKQTALHLKAYNTAFNDYFIMKAQAQKIEERLKLAEAALEPFAAVADDFDADGRDLADSDGIYANVAGDFRRARDIRNELKGGGGMNRPHKTTSVVFIDNFSAGLDEIPRKQLTTKRILSVLDRTGRFSCFEASANKHIARTMTALLKGPLVETYVPESYRGKLEPEGTRGPDQDTYPWTFVRLTEAGRKALETSDGN